ncbi:glycosyltransferase, partial [Paraglaciecola sp.]|uniref:glycosyltransferase n=1 Tax=Paraglaciecola sp. TaxID=1920173 RepID=UPI0027401DBD
MKVSIITVCFNSSATIRGTIESVLAQDYQNIEYIVVDGGSKDSTMDIVNEYRGQIATVVSEPDKGIYDAMNKGIR